MFKTTIASCAVHFDSLVLGLESVALVALWLKNPFKHRNQRLVNYFPTYKAASTTVESALQITLFMQNKANFSGAPMR